MLVGRLGTDGRLNGRVKCDLTENLILKINASVVIVFYFYFCNEENKSSLLSSMLNVLLFFLNFFFHFQLTNEPHYSQGMFNFDYKVSFFEQL